MVRAGVPDGTLSEPSGAFVIGLVQQIGGEALLIPDNVRLFLTTGMMGGLTTYSTFSYETVRLMETNAWHQAWINIFVTTTTSRSACASRHGDRSIRAQRAGVTMRKLDGAGPHADLHRRAGPVGAAAALFGAPPAVSVEGAGRRHRAAGRGGVRPRSILHTAGILKLSADLPLIIEVVDSQEHLDAVLPEVDGMMSGGLITMEKVRVLRYEA